MKYKSNITKFKKGKNFKTRRASEIGLAISNWMDFLVGNKINFTAFLCLSESKVNQSRRLIQCQLSQKDHLRPQANRGN